jgi:succinyl-CoA--D-citramalate CoA-transferase
MTQQNLSPQGPLVGIRVLELGSFIAGPLVGRIYADYGAEVIKVEPPKEGDPMRQWGRSYNGHHLWWPMIARNKKSVTLDLRKSEGREIAMDLAAQCDIVVENFRPGTLERWGLGYEQLKEMNPGIILVRVSGFGQDGPYRDRAGFGSVAEAMGGIRYITGYPDRPPVRAGVSLGDTLAAMYGVMGSLAALQHRNSKGGVGQVIDVAIPEAVLSLSETIIPEYQKLGVVRERTGTILPGVAPSNIYPTKDGSWIIIAGNADSVFRRLCEAMGRLELANDERFATHAGRAKNQELLDDMISQWARQYDLNTLDEMLAKVGVPAGPVYTASDILNDPHFSHRGSIAEVEDPEIGNVKMPNVVPKFGGTPTRITTAGPKLGEHNQEVYVNNLGISLERMRDLIAKEVI